MLQPTPDHHYAAMTGFVPDREWDVPVELVLACTKSSWLQSVIFQRIARGVRPKPDARVFFRGDRLYTQIRFEDEKYQALVLALDVWTLEPTP